MYLELSCAGVDVNVHPAKTEVKFSQERRVFEVVYHAALAALTGEDRIKAPAALPAEKKSPSPRGDTRACARGLHAAADADHRTRAEAGFLPQHDFRAVPCAGLYREGHAETGSQAC